MTKFGRLFKALITGIIFATFIMILELINPIRVSEYRISPNHSVLESIYGLPIIFRSINFGGNVGRGEFSFFYLALDFIFAGGVGVIGYYALARKKKVRESAKDTRTTPPHYHVS